MHKLTKKNVIKRTIIENLKNIKYNVTPSPQSINLYNLYQLSTQGICFVLNHYRDSHKKRPLYKSKKYFMDTIKIKGIKIESDFLYNGLFAD